MSMKLTSLIIEPRTSWREVGPENPLVCKVKLNSESNTLETVVSDEMAEKIIRLVSIEVKAEAAARMDDFIQHVTALEQEEDTPLIEG